MSGTLILSQASRQLDSIALDIGVGHQKLGTSLALYVTLIRILDEAPLNKTGFDKIQVPWPLDILEIHKDKKEAFLSQTKTGAGWVCRYRYGITIIMYHIIKLSFTGVLPKSSNKFTHSLLKSKT